MLCAGNRRPASRSTHAAHIFSFGVVLYEVLAGRRPFAGVNGPEVLQNVIDGGLPILGDDAGRRCGRW